MHIHTIIPTTNDTLKFILNRGSIPFTPMVLSKDTKTLKTTERKSQLRSIEVHNDSELLALQLQ